VEPGPALIYLRPIAREAGHPARRAQLWVAGLQARVGDAVTGRDLDISATRAAIEQQVRAAWGRSAWHTTPRLLRELVPTAHSLSEEPIVVPLAFREVAPPLTEVAGARERASLILSRPLTLVATLEEFEADGRPRAVTRRWQVDQALMSSWLAVQSLAAGEGTAISVEVDRAKIRTYLQTIATEVERPPREGRFDYNPTTNALTIHSPGQNGYTLDLDIAQALVAEACFAAQREVTLPLIAIAPRVTRASLEAITPLTLISEGATSYRGSIPGRLQNIRLAASRFNGVIVPPQAAFSFLDTLGLVTLANGYSEAWVIVGDRTVLGPGGGVCLVSTTCFRAAFWAGLPILDRSPHSYRLPYYEPPLGLDAAVFSPIVDFKFQNNTDAPIIIRTQMDEANEKLVFRFYSKPTGRKVTLDGPTTSNPVPAGAPIYEEDATLEPGAQVLIESPHDGIDAVISRTVEQNGVVLYRDKFFSRYEPWPARYRVGAARR
jgi:vancomycin resistance protein YoaR